VVETLDSLRQEAAHCTRCELYEAATQTVFGEGSADAWLVLVGEQPGDQEDKAGEPFVGPAGRVLAEALDRVGLDRAEIYLTNAVKHFRWKARGKRRLHERPLRSHVVACRPWLRAEIDVVSPDVLVLMGAIAAQSLLGAEFSVLRRRGVVDDAPGDLPTVVATVHPSSILRAPDDERRARMDEFVDDLRVAAKLL